MRLLPYINRLKSEVAPLNNRVEPAKSLVALPDNEINNDLPICFVYTMEESSGENQTINGISQEASKTFAVMYACQNAAGESEHLEDLRDAVKAALLGWTPDEDNISPISYERGKILDTSKRVIWWIDYFSLWSYDESL